MDATSKPASAHTRAKHQAAVVDFDDPTDFDFATRGLIAQHRTNVIERENGVAWDGTRHDFLRDDPPAPDTVHPGL